MLFEKIKLEHDEQVLKIVHKHWFVLAVRIVSVICTTLAPLFGWLALSYLTQRTDNIIVFNTQEYIYHFVFFYSAWLLFNWMMLAHMVTDHHLDVWVLTDRRIISIDQRGLFNRHVGSFRLEKLQDVNIAIRGIVATFLHFGTVEAQTASGSEEEFRAHNLPHPRELKAIILQAADQRMHKQTSTEKHAA